MYKIDRNIIYELNKSYYFHLKEYFNINILHKYNYIYEEAFEHLLEDTERIFNKNYEKNKSINFNKYVIQEKEIYFNTIFMKNLYSHHTLINNLRSDSKQFKKRIRLDKLNKLNKNEL